MTKLGIVYRRVALFILFCLLSKPQKAQTFTVNGRITSFDDGQGVPGVTVHALKQVSDLVVDSAGTISNADGTYNLELALGTHTVTFTHTSYSYQQHSVSGTAGRVVVLDVVLQPKAELLNTVVVSTSRFNQRLSEVTVSMEVLKPEFIEKNGNTSIEQTLDRVSGVGMIDGQPNIRGGAGYSYGAGSRVMVLVDGVPILSGDAGFPSWGFLPVENISQVEVIKGASSALYGSAAMNGVINLRTAYPTSEPLTRLRFFSGVYMNPRDNLTDSVLSINGTDTTFLEKAWWGNTYPTFSGVSASHRQRFGRFDLVAGTYWLTEDNFKMGDYNRKGRFHLNTRYRPSTSMSFGVNGTYERSQSSTFFLWRGLGPDLYKPLPNTMTDNDGHKFTLDPFMTVFGKHGSRHKLMTRWYSNHNRTDQNQDVLSDLYYGEYQFQHRFDSIGLTLTSGVAASYATVVAQLYTVDSLFSVNTGFYVQADERVGTRLNLSGGARYEINYLDSVTESRPVFRLGANYRLAKATFLRASWGQGYRFPTIAEKFVRTKVGQLEIFPNDSLQSETGWTAEVGVKQGLAFSRWQGFADVALFWQEYQNMMEFTYGGASGKLYGFQSINVGATRIAGIEIGLMGTGVIGPVPLDISTGYTFIDPIFIDFDSVADFHSSADYNVLKYRFRHTFKADVETRLRRLAVGASARYYSFMEAIDRVFEIFIAGIADFREQNDNGDWVFDTRLGIEVGDAELWLIVSNVFNNEYTLRPALLEPPRNIVLRLNYDLRRKAGSP